MVIKIDTKTKTERFLAQRPIWRLKLRLVEWIWPKKSHKTKNIVFDLYRGHGSISLASEAGHCSNLKIVPDLASLDQFKFFQWFLCIIFNPLSPPNASFDLKIFHFHTSTYSLLNNWCWFSISMRFFWKKLGRPIRVSPNVNADVKSSFSSCIVRS